MSERDLFLAAIDIVDLSERAAYLDRVCAGDPALRERVESLLQSHENAGAFLEVPLPAADSVIGETLLSDRGRHDPAAEDAATGEPDEAGEVDLTGEVDEAAVEFGRYLEPPTLPNSLGRLGHYEIEAILGSGAFGIVAKAFDTTLHRVVAIKMMRPAIAATSPPRKRFLREARTAASITHGNVIAIYAVEETPIPYLVMEYVLGQTLGQRLNGNGPLEVEEVLWIGEQVAAGLGAAHAVNLIHRDVKPANILLADGPDIRVKLSDFGLARAVDDASLTRSGMITGTPMYMAPEQARGDRLDHRADLFSLGSVLYQMAGGRPPFRAPSTMAILKRVCDDTPRPLDDVIPQTPKWLQDVIFRLLEKDPDSRHQSAREVADVLAGHRQRLRVDGGESPKPDLVDAGGEIAGPAGWRTGPAARGAIWAIGIVLLAFAAYLMRGTTGVGAGGEPQSMETRDDEAPTEAVAAVDAPPVGSGGDAKPHDQPSIGPAAAAWDPGSPQPAIAPFDADAAAAYQQTWADHLGVPLEYENAIGMTLILIPPGTFQMGIDEELLEQAKSLAGDDPVSLERIASARPQHSVVITRPFYIGRTEVTQAQYGRITGHWPAELAETGARSRWVEGIKTANHPVENVSWNDAAEFCSRLSELEMREPRYVRAGELVDPVDGTGYRLPTEAEWEFACRAGTTTRFWPGGKPTDLHRAAWFGANSENRTHSVGERTPNPFGLSDVHGNVFEWVEDGWSDSAYAEAGDAGAVDPTTPFSGEVRRVARGGGWASSNLIPFYASYRRPQIPTYRTFDIGFRVVLPVQRNR